MASTVPHFASFDVAAIAVFINFIAIVVCAGKTIGSRRGWRHRFWGIPLTLSEWIVVVVVLIFINATAFSPTYRSVGKGGTETAEAHSDGNVCARVLDEVFDGSWKTCRETIVQRDGSFRWMHFSLSTGETIESIDGHLSPAVLQALRQDVSLKTGFEMIDGIPTYRYSIDNHWTRHPDGIVRLHDSVWRVLEQRKSGITN